MFSKSALFLKKHDYLFIVLILLSFYFLIVTSLGYLGNLNQLLFSMPDAQSYLSVGKWILGATDPVNPLIRPVLYPALLDFFLAVGGNYAVWGFQFVLWILSGTLLYRSIKSSTGNLFLAGAGLILYAGNLTLLLLTLHALTEITTVFLLVILVSVVLARSTVDVRYYWTLILFILSLLTITRPVFLPLWAIVLLYSLVILIGRTKPGRRRTFFVCVCLASLPVVFQLALMVVNFHQFTISNIGPTTLKTYFLARVYGVINSLSLTQARGVIATWGPGQVVGYLWDHAGTSVLVYFKTILENFLSRSNFTNSPASHIYIAIYMRLVNILYFTGHIIMLLPIIVVLSNRLRKKDWADVELMVSLLLPIWLIFMSSGISFSQGDRLILPALPICIVLYAYDLSRYHSLRSKLQLQP